MPVVLRAPLALLFACGCTPNGAPTTATVDPSSTTSVEEPESCLWLPCITDRADAFVTGEVLAGRFGQEIAVMDSGPNVAVVGGPAAPNGYYDSRAEAVELTLPGLARGASWPTETAWDQSTTAMAIQEDPAGGYVLAVGALYGLGAVGSPGAVYLLHSTAPSGDSLQTAAYATISGYGAGFATQGQIKLGIDVQWLDLTGNGVSELVVSAAGTAPFPGDSTPDGSAIYIFPPGMSGSLDVFDASRKITAPVEGFGIRIAGWDGNLDGVTDLVASQGFVDGSSDRVLVFASPWTDDLTVDDATTTWTLESHNVLNRVANLGDVTGDGVPDLFIGAGTWSGDGVDRGGAAWVIPGGDLTGGSLLDAPMHFYGDDSGDGCGIDAASGDFDGDGILDLAIGCYERLSGVRPGKIVVFLGPLPNGALNESDADVVIHGEYAFDQFGMRLASVDLAQGGTGLLVGAPGADEDTGRVYLLGGDSLFP